jgi:hypothetical protein
VRYIFNLRYDEHITPYYRQLNFLKISERREYNILMLTYKVLKYKRPDYLFEKYTTMRRVHMKETRFSDSILQFPIHRTVTYTNYFHVTSIRLVNLLDREIKNCDSDQVFARKTKKLLLKKYEWKMELIII